MSSHTSALHLEGACRVRTIGMGGVKSPGGAGESKKP